MLSAWHQYGSRSRAFYKGGGVLTWLFHGSCYHANVLIDPNMARAVEFGCACAWGVCWAGGDRLAGTGVYVCLLWAPLETAMEGDPPQCLS